MVQVFLPKIHRMRRRIRRQLKHQRRLLEDAASHFQDPGSNWGAPGESQDFAGEMPHPSWFQEAVSDKEGLDLMECPADLITCPADPQDMAESVRPRGHFQEVPHSKGHDNPGIMHDSHRHSQNHHGEPGPMPGVRPPMGGAGGIVPPPQTKGSGAMGIIMPLYTVGIVVFFVYTIMKVLFKKGQEDDKTPKLRDFGMDPEYRKYVFAEEYLDNNDISTKEQMRRQNREESRSRKKAQAEQPPESKIGSSGLMYAGKMDTQGKNLEDEQLDQLRRRLEETEKAMERLMCQMGSVTDKLTAAKITEVLSQAQAQAKILKIGLDTVLESAAASAAAAKKKEEVGEMTSEEDLTSSEALTTTLSEETSLPGSLRQHLEDIQVEPLSSYSELLAEAGHLPQDLAFSLGLAVDSSLPEKIITTLDSFEFQETPVGATSLEPFVSGDRTVIQLQELKDDDFALAKETGFPGSGLAEAEKISPFHEENNEDSLLTKDHENIETNCKDERAQLADSHGIKNDNEQMNIAVIAENVQLLANVEQLVSNEDNLDMASPALENEYRNEPQTDEVMIPVTPAPKDITPKPPSPTPVAQEQSGEAVEEGSSEATETGADISDLHSFAEENQSPAQAALKEIDGVKSEAKLNEDLDDESESVCKGQGTQTSFAYALPTPLTESKEYGTQTEKEQGVAVLGLNTSFRHDENGIETKGNSQGPVSSHEVTEILLDALLPSETQLLVRDAQVVGSTPMQDIEIEASEAGAVPCIVTSNVSLAFLGLEQRDDITPSPTNNSTLIADERTPDIVQEENTDKQQPSEGPADLHIDAVPTETVSPSKVCNDISSLSTVQEEPDIPVFSSTGEAAGQEMPCQMSSTTQQVVIDNVQHSECIIPTSEGTVLTDITTTIKESTYKPESTLPTQSTCEPSPIEILKFPQQEHSNLEVVELIEPSPSDTLPLCEAGIHDTEKEFPKMSVNTLQNISSPPLEVDTIREHNAVQVVDCEKVSDNVMLHQNYNDLKQTLQSAISESEEKLSDDEEFSSQLNAKTELTVDDAIEKPLNEVLARPSSPLPPHIPDDEKNEVSSDVKQDVVVPQYPVSSSLEAIAEAVAAATTRAALDLLATTAINELRPLEETHTTTSKACFLTEEVSLDQSPVSTDESSTATTVVAVSDTEETGSPDTRPKETEKPLTNGRSTTEAPTIYVATVSHTPSGSPSSTPEVELSGEAVEAALAEAAQEEIVSNSSMTKSLIHEKSAIMEGSGATTPSPKNEDSPTSSKGSSPDMDEYEVITKVEDQANSSTKEKTSREHTSMTSEDKKVKPPSKETQEKEEEEEVKEENDEEPDLEDEEKGEKRVHSNDYKKQSVDSSSKDKSANIADQTEESDYE